jgi:hypothetical protein
VSTSAAIARSTQNVRSPLQLAIPHGNSGFPGFWNFGKAAKAEFENRVKV